MPMMQKPVFLSPINFTPTTRTPWAGTMLAGSLKQNYVPEANIRIGEAWEFSCGPLFPSTRIGSHETIMDMIDTDPTGFLSAEHLKQVGSMPQLLIKTLNADTPLSFQVHPDDFDPNLQPDECGKPESWLVLASQPGSGVYLGFRPGVSHGEIVSRLRQQLNIEDLFHFEEVKAGDFFDIDPGVPHALGPGVVVLEPQRVVPGKSGKTYRLWDWDRCYDQFGNQTEKGKGSPRALHVEEAISCINRYWQDKLGPESTFKAAKRQPTTQQYGDAIVHTYPSTDYAQTAMIMSESDSYLRLSLHAGYAFAMTTEGLVSWSDGAEHIDMPVGQPVWLPHQSLPCRLCLKAKSRLVIVTSATAPLEITPR